LVKADDESADRKTPVADQDRSAVTGRSLEEIAADAGAVWESPRKKSGAKARLAAKLAEADQAPAKPPKAKAAAKTKAKRGKARDFAKEAIALGGKLSKMPEISSPQLATLVDAPFDRE